ncbi:hypothetical protein Ancab_003983, partial [Ancistrocladus abbreviatus]
VFHAGKTKKNSFKALIVAECTILRVNLAESFEIGVTNKTPEFIMMNTITKVPVLEAPDGLIFESNAIAP